MSWDQSFQLLNADEKKCNKLKCKNSGLQHEIQLHYNQWKALLLISIQPRFFLTPFANRLLHSRGDVYCHRQSKQSCALVPEGSVGEREWTEGQLEQHQAQTQALYGHLLNALRSGKIMFRLFIFSHWQSLFNSAFCLLLNSWAGAITRYCHTVTGAFPEKLSLSETAAERRMPCTGLGFWNTKLLCSCTFFVSCTIKPYLEQPDLWLSYYSLATLGRAL